MYPENGIAQFVPQIDSSAHNISQEEGSVVNEVSRGTIIYDWLAYTRKSIDFAWGCSSGREPTSKSWMAYYRSTANFRVHNRLLQQGISGSFSPWKMRLHQVATVDYFRHLMKLYRAQGFMTHHSFTCVSTSMLQRHAALNTSKVFAKRCA